MGRALVAALRAAGLAVDGPLGRGASGAGADVVILAVPDAQIAAAAALVDPGRLVGHCSGAAGLEALAPHEGFGLHPLMTVTGAGTSLAGAACAVAGTTGRARSVTWALALRLGMLPVQVAGEDRAAYHAAASVASNFLVTLESFAERLAATAGLEREHLVPLVRATVENWAAVGPERALTGPVARGDDATVARQRAAVVQRAPEMAALFDALVAATREIRAAPVGGAAVGDAPVGPASARPSAYGTVAA
jgi:predicted short-subunit dehydrogenase-like oxidoreductase (DUF2520 family)